MARLTGRRIVGAARGTATYALPATAWMLGPRGVLHSGVLALLADGALVASVISGLPARTLCTTAELSMTFLGTLPHGRGDVLARGRLLHLDAQMGLAEVYVSDAAGRLVAHGTSRCSVFPPFDDSVELIPPAPVPGEAAHETPDPTGARSPRCSRRAPRSALTASSSCGHACAATCRRRPSTSSPGCGWWPPMKARSSSPCPHSRSWRTSGERFTGG